MNSLLLISPARGWGFQPILSGKLPTHTQSVISEFLISNLKSQISNLKSQISNLKSQISNLKSQISNLKSQISNLKSQISNGINLWGRLAVPTPVCMLLLGANAPFFFATFKVASRPNFVASCPQAAV